MYEEAGSDEEYEYDGDTTDATDDDRVDDSRPARAVYDKKAELAAAIVGSEREAELEAAAAMALEKEKEASAKAVARHEALKKQAHAKAVAR